MFTYKTNLFNQLTHNNNFYTYIIYEKPLQWLTDLMPSISYTKYPTQKWILPFCSAEKGLSSATKFFCFRLFLP